MSWDPTPGQRKVVFGAVVVVLVAAGVYFTFPTFRNLGGPGQAARSPAAAGQRGDTAPPATPAEAISPSAATTSPEATPGLEDLLPLSEDQIAEAVETARRFVSAYATYRYDEEPAEYRARLEPYVTDPIAEALADGDTAAPAVQDELRRDEVVATATATVEGTRLVSSDSVVVLVRADQAIESTRGMSSEERRYAVTVVDSDGSWKAANLSPAEAGNAGDVS